MTDIIGAFRRKVYATAAKVREIVRVDEDGEVQTVVRVEGGPSGEMAVYDSTPIQPPIGYQKQPSMTDYMYEAIRRHELDKEAAAAGFETWDEADDFDVDDDPFPQSEHEGDFDPIDYNSLREVVDDEKARQLEVEGGTGVKTPVKPSKKAAKEAQPPLPDDSDGDPE